jgi:hypothetical protein
VAAFSAQDFLLALAEGKQLMEAIPLPAARPSRRRAMGKER